MSLYGVGLNVQVQRINTELRFFISNQKGGTNLRNLARIFNEMDANKNGRLEYEEFKQALNRFGFFLKNVDYQCLLKYFDVDRDGHISFSEFLAGIKQPLNERRLNIVLKIFDTIDEQRSGLLSVSQLAERVNVDKNKAYQSGTKSREAIVDDFLRQFEWDSTGQISRNEFVSFYEDLGLGISSDQLFVDTVVSSWAITEDDDLQVSQEEVKSIVKTIRSKLIQMTNRTTEEFLLRKLFKEFDLNKSGFLSLDELHAMLIKLEIPIQKRYLSAVFQKFDRNRSGVIEFDEFAFYIINDPYP